MSGPPMSVVIMAGGSGTRFWPASRAHLPKQFLAITGRRTMLEETLDRAAPLAAAGDVYVVVNRLHADLTRRLLAGRGAQILVEPVGRNTAPCVGLAALHAARVDPDRPIAVLPADHFIADAERFARLLEAAGEVARTGAIVTLGIPPTRPETGFGYIAQGDAAGEALGETVYQVEQFVEKPDRQTALAYVTGGRHLWNSGIFVFTARTVLAEIEAWLPGLRAGLAEIAPAIGRSDYEDVLGGVYPELASVSIDYGVMEKTQRPVRVLRGDFGWSDVGSWQALYELRGDERDGAGNLLLGEALAVDARDNLVYATAGRTVALLGVEGLVVVDTPDALLVADRSRSQDVKKFPELLKQRAEETTNGHE